MSTASEQEQAAYRGEALAVRSIIGGALMGLANLVPGISGGTMLLAVGVYPQFINGVAEVSTLRFRPASMLTLACIVGGAIVAIFGLAGTVGTLVVDHRWIMYSLFIGLTLGGVPILWSMLKPIDTTAIIAAVLAITAMAALAFVQPPGNTAAAGGPNMMLLFVAGLAGASAMVLPGISGGYLLLLLGQYVAILTAVDLFKDGLTGRDSAMLLDAMRTVIPVGLGVVAGVIGVSNVVRVLLRRFERATLGALLGLLLGAVIGLWPFQTGVAPAAGSVLRGERVVEVEDQLVLETSGRPVDAADYATRTFTPGGGQIAASFGLVVLGFVISAGIAHLGGSRPLRETDAGPETTADENEP